MKQRHGYSHLRVMAEYCSSGIWTIKPIGVFRHSMVAHSALRLPVALSQRFKDWIAIYDARLTEIDRDTEAFNTEGRSLAEELKAYVGSTVHVEYLPELPDGGLGLSEVVGDYNRNVD